MVSSASELMPQAVTAIGLRYDPSKVRREHAGADGKPGASAPGSGSRKPTRSPASTPPTSTARCLHASRRKSRLRMLDVVSNGSVEEACAELFWGGDRIAQVAAYLCGNSAAAAVEAPS